MEVIENGHPSERKLKEVLSNCFSNIGIIVGAFLKRFPRGRVRVETLTVPGAREKRSVRCDKSIQIQK